MSDRDTNWVQGTENYFDKIKRLREGTGRSRIVGRVHGENREVDMVGYDWR